MAQEYCTGSIHIYVEPRFNNNNLTAGINYLGTCETAPQRQTNRPYKQLRNDLSSDQAFDYVYAGGSEAVVSLVLTRWNDDVAQNLEISPFGGIGYETIDDMGALMGQEGLGVKLHIIHAFGGIVDARPTMLFQEAGRIYQQAIFWGPESDEGGSRERKKHMVFRCWKFFDPSDYSYTLFTEAAGGYTID